MKIAFTLGFGLFLSCSTFAADRVLTCTLSDFKDPTRTSMAQLNLSSMKVKSDLSQSSDKEIQTGTLSYDFDLKVRREKKDYKITLTFFENNLVQDSVGSIDCVYKDKMKGKWFCVDSLYSDDKRPIHDIHCQVL